MLHCPCPATATQPEHDHVLLLASKSHKLLFMGTGARLSSPLILEVHEILNPCYLLSEMIRAHHKMDVIGRARSLRGKDEVKCPQQETGTLL